MITALNNDAAGRVFRIAVLCLSLLLLQCSEAPPNPTEVLVSPLDPQSPSFVKPRTTILISPGTTDTLTVPETTISVQGNEPVVSFSYKLDGNNWSAWSSSPSIALTDLDEGVHQFTVRALHKDNVTVEENPPGFRFTVNAVAGPALMFAARKKEVQFNSSFNYYILTDEVRNIYGAKSVFTYDNTAIRINSVSSGTIRNISVQLLEQRYGNTVRAEMFFTGSTSMSGITGSDTILVINCTALRTGETIFTFVADSVQLRDTSNTAVTVRQLVNGKVVVR